ncbi:MAG TPA: CRISPR-associated helicase Cas3', partial [Clostridia bacterium]
MYSPDLLAYLILGISYIARIGGKFAILTATLPGIVTDLLKMQLENYGITFEQPEPFLNDNVIRHSLKIIHDGISTDYVVRSFNNNKVLVICNTVKIAQKVYSELMENKEFCKKCKNINLFHSKFIKKDRKEKEDEIVSFGKGECQESGVWIATQVVEASLDIDFDVLLTELSDINGLFQRMGRCYRNRVFNNEDYNCFVFDGGGKTCSGVGKFIDEKLFEFSKEALKNIDGKITETKKQDIIKYIYNTEKLKDTEYYKEVLDHIRYVQSIREHELDKKEVSRRFRNISNITIIPSCVYQKEKAVIDDMVAKVQTEEDKKEKRRLIDKINEFTVDVPLYEVEGCQCVTLNVTKYMNVLIYDGFEYDDKIGLKKIPKSQSPNAFNADNQIM